MPYSLGDEVLVTTIGKAGRVVAVSRGGRYRVLVGGIEVACREVELEVAASARQRGRRGEGAERRRGREAPGRSLPESPDPLRSGRLRRAPPSVTAKDRPSEAERVRLGSIDLHGATVEEALGAVEARLDAAILAGLDHLDVIHGIGTGKIRHALHRFLRGIGAVRHFEVTRDNPGVTRVYF